MLQLAVLLLVTGMMTWSQSQLTPKHKKCHQKTQGTCSRLPLLLNSEKTGDDKEVLYVDDNGDSWVPFVESGGFCNHIYKSNRRDIRDGDEQQLSRRILKIYSDLAMKRMELSGDKRSQELMGKLGIGPSILNSTETYMIMEELEGQVLTHDTLLSSRPDSIEVIRSVATTLAKLHSIPYISNGKQSKNMLWSCCDVFLSQIQENDDGLYRQYKEELSTQKQALDTLQLPLVLGHGDFKPSNVIILDESGEAKLVDWETCGCHFRAYDLAKFFRMTSPMTEQEHQKARVMYSPVIVVGIQIVVTHDLVGSGLIFPLQELFGRGRI
eukprot:scaffold2315_cov113-Cylindrotheca_fusiformis.AAC.10